MAGYIKNAFPKCRILFLGRTYTKAVVELSEYVDDFIDYDEIEKMSASERIPFVKKFNADIFVHVFPKKEIAVLAKKCEIELRVGTTNRLYHWFTCNKIVRLSRRKSNLHEAQLNIQLLSFLNIPVTVKLNEIKKFYGFSNVPRLSAEWKNLINTNKFNLILHPKSKGSAAEWGLENFEKLIDLLPLEKYNVFISGTVDEATLMQGYFTQKGITNLAGKFSLPQFIAFINACDGLIAASTGPLHIAAALKKKAIGLFVPKKPIHPTRWQPIGENANYLVYDQNCVNCKNGKDCNCISKILPQNVLNILNKDERI
jgi:heptosyltransferase III